MQDLTTFAAAPRRHSALPARRALLTALAASATLLIAAGVTSRAGAQDIGIRVGQKAPTAVIESLDGAPADLAQWIGRTPVLLEFWATWCGNCRQLEPTLRAAHDKYGDRVRFIGIAVSVNQSQERVRRHMAQHRMPLHDMLYDRDADLSEAFEVPATSYIVVIDSTGTVVYTGLGGRQNLDAALEKAVTTGS
ncbi:MAG TPA: TlpA disulfide reductase family protein [Gemmatimonadaceae bacterium]|nr:TlpA disulfide reductase family protein [Gemmatimonadaceae bacterium]